MKTFRPQLGFPLLATVLVLNACSGADQLDPVIGYVEADWIYVAAPQSGWINSEPFVEGMAISKGDILFALDTTAQEAILAEANARFRQSGAEARNISTGARTAEIKALEARLAEAEARLAKAVMDKERLLPLVERGLEPKTRGDTVLAEADMATASVEALKQDIVVARQAARPAAREAADAATQTAKAVIDTAAYQLSQRTIVSGVSGRLEEVFLRTGEYATAGAPVVAILPDDGLKVRFFVHQADLSGIAIGETVSVRADGLATPLDGVVSYISDTAEFTPPVIYSKDARGKLVFLVEARVPGGSGLKPGLPTEVSW